MSLSLSLIPNKHNYLISEGIYLELEYSVNFKLGTTHNKTKLAKQLSELYATHKKDFHSYVSITLLQIGKNIASQFPTEDFFAKRLKVQEKINKALIFELEPRYFNITSALIVGVQYSTRVKVNMQYRETANQQIEALRHKVKTSEIKAETLVANAKIQAETKTEEVSFDFKGVYRLRSTHKHT